MSWHVKLDICLEVAHKSMRWTNEQYHRFEIMNVLQTRSSEQSLELMRARNVLMFLRLEYAILVISCDSLANAMRQKSLQLYHSM
jgi:hypothetical protein